MQSWMIVIKCAFMKITNAKKYTNHVRVIITILIKVNKVANQLNYITKVVIVIV